MSGLPYRFVPDTIADANQVNANFQFLLGQQPYFIPQVPFDDVSDAFPAIASAIEAATANGGGTVLIPAGDFLLSQMLTINAGNVNLIGLGSGTTALIQNFTPSSTNPAILMLGQNSNSCMVQAISFQGPGVSAIGTVPGPTTPTSPQLGTGWAVMNFGGTGNTVSFCQADGTYHGFGGVTFGRLKFNNCIAGMGGPQTATQYGFYAQGPQGAAAVGQIVLTGVPTLNDTLTAIFNDGQGNVINTGPYTVTSANAGSLTATAIAFANFINNSDAVVGSSANWNLCAPSAADINLSIDVPSTASTPTYQVAATGVMGATPTAPTLVTGGTRLKNPVSQVFAVIDCQMPQAQLKVPNVGSFASSEGIHIDGAVTSTNIQNFGTTGALYTLRVANVNSGSDKDAQFVLVQNLSGDHTRVNTLSVENGNVVYVNGLHAIANFGQGPPPTASAVNIGPFAGGGSLNDINISSCDGGGVQIATGSWTLSNFRIFQVGRRYLSGINLYGTQPIIGLTIKNGKIGAQNLASGGNGANSYGIDLVGPGAPVAFTSTLQSLTIEDVDVTGIAGAINTGTVISAALSTFGLAAYNTIKNCAGYNPVLGVSQPTPPTAGTPTAPVLNPFAADCSVWIVPAGGATVTQIVIITNDGTIAQTVSYTAGFNVQVPANASITLSFSSGTVTWNWWPS